MHLDFALFQTEFDQDWTQANWDKRKSHLPLGLYLNRYPEWDIAKLEKITVIQSEIFVRTSDNRIWTVSDLIPHSQCACGTNEWMYVLWAPKRAENGVGLRLRRLARVDVRRLSSVFGRSSSSCTKRKRCNYHIYLPLCDIFVSCKCHFGIFFK